MSVEATIFDQPSGNVRGIVIAMMPVGKDEKRIAHAHLFTDGTEKFTITVPAAIQTADQLGELMELLAEFKLLVEQYS
jgi:hypothetical protein